VECFKIDAQDQEQEKSILLKIKKTTHFAQDQE